MPRRTNLMLLLALSVASLSVSACSTQASRTSPPVRDLIVQAKPAPSIDSLTSELAGVNYDNAVEKWGEDGWLQVGRLCRWAADNKLPHPDCPRP
jgi:hypothetical protein